MFTRLDDGAPTVAFVLDGAPAIARVGDTVAAALLANGLVTTRRSPIAGEPRGAYCMIGVCFECLVTIDGVGNRQGCLVTVSDGMRVETGAGRRKLAAPP
jgi:D-hydroxyproline dehydrogenase subunit gamma